jgi:hypothetical protein
MRGIAVVLLFACGEEPEPEPGFEAARLVIDTPAPASWVAPGPVVVSGLAHALKDVEVNGAPAEVDGERFTAIIEVGEGVTAFEVHGTDNAGDDVYERRSLVAGRFGSDAGFVDDAVALRLSATGLQEVLDTVAGAIDVPALVAQVQNPVVTGVVGFFDYEISLLRLTMAPPRVSAELADGVMRLTVEIEDIQTTVGLAGGIAPLLLDTTATSGIDRLTAAVDVRLYVAGGGLDVELSPIAIDLRGFTFDASLIPFGFEDQIPILSDAVEQFLVSSVEEQVSALAPEIVDGFESQLLLSFSTTILDTTATVDARFASVAVDPDGLELGLDMGLTLSGEGAAARYAGVLTLPAAPHEVPVEPDVGVSLHDDLLNRILFEAWQAGLLNLTITTEDLPLLGTMLSDLGSTEGSIQVTAHLPPVAIQREGQLDLQVGELDLRLETVGGDYGDFVVIRMAGKIPINPSIEGGELGVEIGTPELSLMVVDTDWNASNDTITDLLEAQIPLDSLLSLVGVLAKFEIPPFAGLLIEEATAARASSGVHTVLELNLGPAPVVP